MLNFKIRLLDIHDEKWERIFKDPSFKSRGAFYLLREVWFSKTNLAFLRRVFNLSKSILEKQEDFILNIMEYLVTGHKMKPELWKKAEAEAIKKGLLKKGGYMDIRKYIAERAQQEGWQKGKQEGQQEVVLNMLKNKMDAKLITKVTGLSEKEINKLKNGN